MLNLSRLHVTVGILTREHTGTPPGAGGQALSEGGAELLLGQTRPPGRGVTLLQKAAGPTGTCHQ